MLVNVCICLITSHSLWRHFLSLTCGPCLSPLSDSFWSWPAELQDGSNSRLQSSRARSKAANSRSSSANQTNAATHACLWAQAATEHQRSQGGIWKFHPSFSAELIVNQLAFSVVGTIKPSHPVSCWMSFSLLLSHLQVNVWIWFSHVIFSLFSFCCTKMTVVNSSFSC